MTQREYMGKPEFSCCFPVKISNTQGAQSPSNTLLFPYFPLTRFLLQTRMRIQALETLSKAPQHSQNLCTTPTKTRDTDPSVCRSHSSSHSRQQRLLFLPGPFLYLPKDSTILSTGICLLPQLHLVSCHSSPKAPAQQISGRKGPGRQPG